MRAEEMLKEVTGSTLEMEAVAERVREVLQLVRPGSCISFMHGQDSSPDRRARRDATSTTSTSSTATARSTRSSPSPRRRSRTSTIGATPPQLAGSLYPEGIPILPESALEQLVREHEIDVGRLRLLGRDARARDAHRLARARGGRVVRPDLARGRRCSLRRKPSVAICAVRTGSGKSQTTRHVADCSATPASASPCCATRCRTAISPSRPCSASSATKISRQQTRRSRSARSTSRISPRATSSSPASTTSASCARPSRKRTSILWDGGNNDTPFIKPDLHIVVVDPHRPGHELRYHPGETNLRMADVCVVNKIDSATQEGIDAVLDSIHENNADARIVLAASPFEVEGDAEEIRGKRVLAIEDGPTLTHGEMTYGAAVLAAKQYGAAELVDPRPFAVGSIAETFEQYPNVGTLLPAMGYGREQMDDLARDDRALRRRPRPDRHADRPAQADRARQAGAARDLQASGDRRADVEGRARREGTAGNSTRVSTVVALGGNALMRPGERGTAAEQLANLRRAVTALQPLLARAEGLVITHGNGPQVGNELLRQERAADGGTTAAAVARRRADAGGDRRADRRGAAPGPRRPRGRVPPHARERRAPTTRPSTGRRSRSGRSTPPSRPSSSSASAAGRWSRMRTAAIAASSRRRSRSRSSSWT